MSAECFAEPTPMEAPRPKSAPPWLEAATPKSSRLAALRQDLLDAPYELCAAKARLMTEAFSREPRFASRLAKPLERAHYRAYLGGLARRTASEPVPRWNATLNDGLMAAWDRLDGASPADRQVAFAEALAHTLDRLPLRIYDHELVVGNASSRRIGAPIHPDLGGMLMAPELDALGRRRQNPVALDPDDQRALQEQVFPFWYRRSVLAHATRYSHNPALADQLTRGRDYVLTQIAGISHVTPDYPRILEQGFRGLLRRIEMRRTASDDADRQAFYEATRITAEAAIRHGSRWAAHLDEQARTSSNPERSGELRDLANLLRRVPEHGARTFHEAVQSLFLTHAMLHYESFQHGISFGRLDQILQPFYEQDLAAGRITPERAVEILGCLLGKAAELLPLFFDRATEYFSGLSAAAGITLAGTDAAGRCAVNDVSWLILEAYDQMRLRQPNLHVRVAPHTDPSFLARCAEVVKGGGGMPAFFNDAEVVPALIRDGVPPAEAESYAVVGCAEWGVPGRSFPAAGAGFVNLAQILRDAVMALDSGREPTDVEAVFRAFARRLRTVLEEVAEGNDAIEQAHTRHRPTPMLSTLVAGCLERGRDITAGGAAWNRSGLQGVGLADVVDSLAALETCVFGRPQVGLARLRHALDNDFADDAELAELLTRKAPRYGEDAPPTGTWARRVSALYRDEVARLSHYRGGRYAAGFWTMTTHQGFGRRTGALPSGRRAGAPLAAGASPRLGSERFGATASLSSAAQVGTTANGVVVNQKLSPCWVKNAEGTELLVALIRGYFDQGGAQVQFNVVDADTLRRARNHPEAYRDLVVRISGYSAYFHDLTPAVQDELIERYEHGG